MDDYNTSFLKVLSNVQLTTRNYENIYCKIGVERNQNEISTATFFLLSSHHRITPTNNPRTEPKSNNKLTRQLRSIPRDLRSIPRHSNIKWRMTYRFRKTSSMKCLRFIRDKQKNIKIVPIRLTRSIKRVNLNVIVLDDSIKMFE